MFIFIDYLPESQDHSGYSVCKPDRVPTSSIYQNLSVSTNFWIQWFHLYVIKSWLWLSKFAYSFQILGGDLPLQYQVFDGFKKLIDFCFVQCFTSIRKRVRSLKCQHWNKSIFWYIVLFLFLCFILRFFMYNTIQTFL